MTVGMILIGIVGSFMLLFAIGAHRQRTLDEFRRDACNGYVVGFYHAGALLVGEVIGSAANYVIIRLASGATFKRMRD